jgi:hypothetical protein
MNDLLKELETNAGLTPEKAKVALETVKAYILKKVPPQFAPILDNFLASQKPSDDFLD